MEMKRRNFLSGLLLAPVAALSAVGALVQSCGEDAIPVPLDLGCSGLSPSTMDLHNHPTCISSAVVAFPDPTTNVITLDFGTTGHQHTITLTAAQIADIDAGTTVIVTSSLTGHTHQVRFN